MGECSRRSPTIWEYSITSRAWRQSNVRSEGDGVYEHAPALWWSDKGLQHSVDRSKPARGHLEGMHVGTDEIGLLQLDERNRRDLIHEQWVRVQIVLRAQVVVGLRIGSPQQRTGIRHIHAAGVRVALGQEHARSAACRSG
jgi:hypothetical protein